MSLSRRLLGAALAARTAWVMVGLTLLLALGVECAGALYYKAHAKLVTRDDRTQLDAFADAPWVGDYFHEIDGSAQTAWHSYVYWRRRPFAGKYINIDERGVRRSWQPPADAGREPIRIFLFGGSTMWGVGARDEYTIASWLARLLAERAPGVPIEVTNWAESGYVSSQELLTLELALQRQQIPDLAIFYHAINDVFAAYQNGVAGGPQNEFNRRIDFENFTFAALYRIARSSNAMRPLMWRVLEGSRQGGFASRTPESRRALVDDVVTIYEKNVEFADALGRRFDFETLFYWQPVIFTKPRLTQDERGIQAVQENMREIFELSYARARESRPLAGNPRFHDIRGVFGADARPLYIDCCHTTETGNEIVARRMLADVAPLLPGLR